MIPLIQQAMVMGYGAEKILSFLGNKIPGMQGGLSNAKKNGYSDDDILNFLKNKIPQKDPEGSKKYSNQLDTYLSENGIQTKEQRAESRNKGIKTALGVAGTAFGAYKAYENYSGIFDQLKGYFDGDKEKSSQMENPELEQMRQQGLASQPLQPQGQSLQDMIMNSMGQEVPVQTQGQPMQQPGQPMQPQQPGMGQTQQVGPGQQALMAILQKIQASRGAGG